jgi:hypothetical protein
VYGFLVGNLEGRRPVGRPRNRWEEIKEDVKEARWEVVYWIHLDQNRD